MRKIFYHNIYASLLLGGVLLILPFKALAIPSDYQQCVKDQTCTIGEFLYDDSYVPIATAACTMTSRYPDGSVFINSQTMDATADGWYSYDVVATGSAGFYRSQVCCTSDGDYMCLDKSFKIVTASSSSSLTSSEIASAVWDASRSAHSTPGTFGEIMQNLIPSADAIAEAVWGHSSRTLSGFGTLVSDIWSSSTRSLTSFSLVASDVWSYASRTLTGTGVSTGDLATKDDLEALSSKVSALGTSTTGLTAAQSKQLTTVEKLSQENRLLLEQIVKKPIIQNFVDEDKTPDLTAKLKETDITSRQIYVGINSAGGKLGLVSARWDRISSKELLSVLGQVNTFVGDDKSASKNTILGGLKSLKSVWDMAMLEDMYQEAQALRIRLDSLQSEVRAYGKSSAAYDDVLKLTTSLSEIETKLGSQKDAASKETFFARINTIRQLSVVLDKHTAQIDKLLAGWSSYKQDDLKSKTVLLVSAVGKVNIIPQAMESIKIDPRKNQSNKQLKNKVLDLKGVLDANRTLLARSSDKPLASTWLAEGSIIFKSLVTNPSALISQEVPLQYYLPKEVTKESIVSVDEGLTVEYDNEKDQLYVKGNFTLAPEQSKTISVTVDEGIFQVPKEAIATLRTQAETLSQPLKNTSYFAQGVTLVSDINVSLDKVTALQKAAVTPEGRIKAYREAQIELNAVKIKIEKLKELVTQASSAGSLMGFVGGAQAVGVWGLIIIIIAGFVTLFLYMRVLKPHHREGVVTAGEDETEVKSDEKELLHHKNAKKSGGFGLPRLAKLAGIVLVFTAGTAGISGFVVYKAMSSQAPAQAVAAAPVETTDEGREEVVLGAKTASASSQMKEEDAQIASEDLVQVEIQETGTGFLRVRSTPGGKEITRVLPGEMYEVLSEQKDWWEIALEDGESGWVSKQYAIVNEDFDL